MAKGGLKKKVFITYEKPSNQKIESIDITKRKKKSRTRAEKEKT